MRLASYIRVSTAEQANEGVSLEAQYASIYECANRIKATIEFEHRDIQTGKNRDRKGFEGAMGRLHSGEVDGLIVYKLDRFSRSLPDIANLVEEFNKNGWHLISVRENLDTTTATGRMIIHILGTFAQFERELISDRTREALAYKKMKGEVYGKVPFGYDRVGDKLVINQREWDLTLHMGLMRRDGTSYGKIAEWLNNAGISTKSSSGTWHASSVRYILNRVTK